jgi:hypothetical protein
MNDFHPPAVRSSEAGPIVLAPVGSMSLAEALLTIPAVDRAVCSIASAIVDFIDMLKRAWDRAQRAHHRQALREAYLRRREWRKADIPRLKVLGVNPSAQRRILALECRDGRGRGVVRCFRPLDEYLVDGFSTFAELMSSETPPAKRMALLKKSKIWPYIIFALYEFQHRLAKQSGKRAPSTHAEYIVAQQTGISEALVHKLCQKARRSRPTLAQFFPSQISLEVFIEWKHTGTLDERFILDDEDAAPDSNLQ